MHPNFRPRGVVWPPVDALRSRLVELGFAPAAVAPLAGDASQRRFFRVALTGGGTVVAALYPAALAEQAGRDHAVQEWGFRRGLPIPRPLAAGGEVTVSEDLGDVDLQRALAAGDEAMPAALEALGAFQASGWDGLPTPPFDAAFFRRELAGFEAFTVGPGADPAIAPWLDALAARVAGHPQRLVHRDFHVNNLFLRDGRVLAVDFQDMRAGPDTYDLASLLRERAGAELIAAEASWKERAARGFDWAAGWERRYLECAAQRGLKVIGTFLRLASQGRRHYLDWVPPVVQRTLEALGAIDAPAPLCAAAAAAGRTAGL